MRAVAPATLLALAGVFASPADAQGRFPSRPNRLVSPFAAGGVTDISLRLLADKLATRLHAQIVIDHQPRAGGVTAAATVLSAAAEKQ